MRHPELKQLYNFSLESENIIKDSRAQEVLNAVLKNWDKKNFYDLEEQRFIKLCLDYNEQKEEKKRQLLADMLKKMSAPTAD